MQIQKLLLHCHYPSWPHIFLSLQHGEAKEAGLQTREVPIDVSAILSSRHLTIGRDLTDHLLQKSAVCYGEKENPLTFFKFLIFLSTSGSPEVTAGAALRGALCGAEDCVESWFASALASCRQINTLSRKYL